MGLPSADTVSQIVRPAYRKASGPFREQRTDSPASKRFVDDKVPDPSAFIIFYRCDKSNRQAARSACKASLRKGVLEEFKLPFRADPVLRCGIAKKRLYIVMGESFYVHNATRSPGFVRSGRWVGIQQILSDESRCIGPALPAMLELTDDLFVVSPHFLQFFLGRRNNVGKIRLRYERHDIHDRRAKLLERMA
jgi:hypothetical protein